MMRLDDIKALAQQAHRDDRKREELFATMFRNDGKESYYASWALTHLPAVDNILIAKHRHELVSLAISTPDTSLRRLSLVLLERLEWPPEEVRADLLDFCLAHMAMADEPYGVKALCIKLAYLMCRHYPELKSELRNCLLMMEPQEQGAGVRHTRNQILSHL